MVKINANLKNKKTGIIIIPNTTTLNIADVAKNQALSATLVNTPDKSTLGYPSFSTLVNYSIGQIVYYGNKLYKFKAVHSAGAWDDAHVDEVSIKEDLRDYSDTKISKVSNPTVNNIPIIDNNGELIDSNIGIDKIPHIDGFYEGMGVGVAKRLEGNVNNPGSFLERTTGGDAELANGLAQLNEVQGGSVKFNQLISNAHATGTYDGDASAASSFFSVVSGHKYYISAIDKTLPVKFIRLRDTIGGLAPNYSTGEKAIVASDITSSNTTRVQILGIKNAYEGQSYDVYFKCIDLTAIFGAGNEPSTVAEFEAWLAENVGLKDYYDFTEGEVVNNNMTGIESNGFNLFNPTTGKARIIGAYSEVYGNYYGIRGTYGTLTFEDDLGNVSTVTPDADGKFECDIAGTIDVADYGADCCVFLWWDGKKTEYEDYDVNVAHLDVRHIYGKKNGTGELVQVWPTGMPRINDVVDKLCIDNGAVVAKRNLQEVDFGTLSWVYSSASGHEQMYSNGLIGQVKIPQANFTLANILCAKYKTASGNNVYSHASDNIISIGLDGCIYLYSSTMGTDAATFKTAMSGVMLYYELATHETYTDLVYMGSEYFADGTPVALPVNYKVDNWGVESILPKNTSTILTAKPTIKVRYAIDAVEQLDTHSDKIEDLYDGLDELDGKKANTVGVYDDMVVGAAKAIAGNQRLDEVFTSMVVEGADGVAKINEVRGKSLVWNQLVQNGNFSDGTTGWSGSGATISVSDGVLSWVATDTTDTNNLSTSIAAVNEHKYYVSFYIKGNKSLEVNGAIGSSSGGGSFSGGTITYGDSWTKVGVLSNPQTGTSPKNLYIRPNRSGAENAEVQIKNVMCIDLTQMFGAGNEPATVEEFEALFPDAYYEYNDGEIINNATEELDVYDSEETLKSTVPLNLSTITGKQVGVEGAESVVIFPDGMRQAGSVADTLLVDDDGYARRAVVKIGSVDMGTLTWNTMTDDRFIADVVLAKAINNFAFVCPKYKNIISVCAYNPSVQNAIWAEMISGRPCIRVRDNTYSDAATFKAAMVGVELIYELAEYKEYILDEPILMTFKAYHGGTIVQSPQAPDSSPMSMNVTFALDAVGTINNLPKNYISADSMDAFLAQLGTAMNGTWTKSWDAANNRYGFTFTPNEEINNEG